MPQSFRNSIFSVFLKTVFKRPSSIEVSRARGERLAKWMGKPPVGISVEKFEIDGLPVAWISPEMASNPVILYLHGGGYVSGS